MSTRLDLKEIERKAFRSTYQDGLWDLCLGLIVVAMSISFYRPAEGYSLANPILAVSAVLLANGLLWAGKRFITLPRMGQVRFGAIRKQKGKTLALILGAVILVQVGIVALPVLSRVNPELATQVNASLTTRNLMDLAVAAIGSLFVGPSMILIAHFSDFPRGYYIAVLTSLAVFLMIYLNQPIYPILIGALIVVPGLVLFVRFLKTYPLPRELPSHE